MNQTISLEISLEALIDGDRAEFARLVDAYSADLVHAPIEKPDLPDDVRERLFKRLNLDDYLDQKP